MIKSVMGALAFLPAALASLPVWANGSDGYGGHFRGHGHMWDWGGHGMFLGPLFMFLFIVAVVVAIVLIVRWLGGRGGRGGAGAARAVLDERFARGEIDREDYLARKKDLG